MANSTPGQVIRPGEIYTTKSLKSRLDLGDWAMRKLKVHVKPIKFGKQNYYRSDDVIAFFNRLAEGEK